MYVVVLNCLPIKVKMDTFQRKCFKKRLINFFKILQQV